MTSSPYDRFLSPLPPNDGSTLARGIEQVDCERPGVSQLLAQHTRKHPADHVQVHVRAAVEETDDVVVAFTLLEERMVALAQVVPGPDDIGQFANASLGRVWNEELHDGGVERECAGKSVAVRQTTEAKLSHTSRLQYCFAMRCWTVPISKIGLP